ncbi:MAG: hypothetical protein QOG43_1801 [Actinomycetota bacterium]|jgi:hypothetical protein|nr:hypothetical protein [Actinomycetota bacterium]
MSNTRSRVVAFGALLAVALLVVTPAARADTASDEARVLTLLNQTRATAGVPALGIDSTLASVARVWATTMATAGTISHNPSLSTQIVGWSRLGENVGKASSVDAVHQALLNSPGHYANMIDGAFNAVGIGVASAGGYVYVVQDFAKLAVPAPRAPTLPIEVTPAGGTLRTAPTQVSARYTDPDGTPGYVYFVLADATGAAVRQGWSTPACSGCVATLAIAPVPDGIYALYAAANDGGLASGWSGPQVFWVDHTAPSAPAAVTTTRTQASARYADPDGAAGYVYFWVVAPGGAVVKEGWSGATCNGCTATLAVPALGPGVHTVYALAYDGLASALTGPVLVTL